MTTDQTDAQRWVDGPSGIGGWLILPLLGLFATPIAGIAFLLEYGDILEVMSFLNTAQATFIIFEIAINFLFLVLAPVALLILCFRKHSRFPKLYIVWAIGAFAVQILDLVAAYVLFREFLEMSDEPFFDPETVRGLARTIATVVIWVPYMLRSRRVKNTFVR